MLQRKNIITNHTDNNNVGGVEVENISTENRQTTVYNFDKSHYEIVRIFSKSKSLDSIIEESISLGKEADTN